MPPRPGAVSGAAVPPQQRPSQADPTVAMRPAAASAAGRPADAPTTRVSDPARTTRVGAVSPNRPAGGPPTGGPPTAPPGGGSGGGAGGGGKGKGNRWRTIRRVCYGLIAAGIIVPALAFMLAYIVQDVPRPGELQTNQAATIYNSDGQSVITKVIPPEGNRTEVDIDAIPLHVRNAVLAAEDRDFYSNPGFSITGFARAARDNVLGRESAGGGSTITQQYVKVALVGSERTLTRKLKELVLSTKMANQWSKDDILAAYLNTIYFGRGAYGIAAASNAYFGKPVGELTVEEGAVLASSIQLPSLLDPETNPEGAEARWNYVLDGMVTAGTLDAAQRAGMQYPAYVPIAELDNGDQSTGPEGLIKNQVIAELAREGIDENLLNTAGLEITTTIDTQAQEAALDAVRTNLENEPEELRTAVVSVDPRSGAIRAYYGGESGVGFDFAQSGLQTGSSFKVFGLAANLEQGVPLSQTYDSGPLTVNGISIGNVEGESCGQCTIAEALKRSLNTSFYRMMLQMDNGPQAIADMAHKLGVAKELPGIGPTLTEPDGAGPNYGIVLGQYQSRVLDMASAYATLAASGVHHDPYFVQKVVTSDGEVLLDRGTPAGEQVVDAAVADNTTSAMTPIAAYSNGHALAGGRPSAAKTGTAQLGDTGSNKDAWMVGFTPSLSTAVWIGTEDGLPLENRWGGMIYGSGLPSDIWKDTMDGALEGTEVESFPKPDPIAGVAGVPAWTAPATATATTQQQTTTTSVEPTLPEVPQITTQNVEIFPGVTIPVPGVAPQTTTQQVPVPGGPGEDEGPAGGTGDDTQGGTGPQNGGAGAGGQQVPGARGGQLQPQGGF
ncbi:penicillin-binding protein [Rhodococcus sp. Z13]|uniref:Penicillin-binding protein n=1 Tax=Rhodococcus sacchari TaxID=2962047 RepID=A0ACD4DFV2_9NOCA|nr:transglycosylase domain-containing protein [Rhodococcus sp. Z13]UYP18947.1 penicillin-binding protein [Rhodococcus sp. Z13]